MTLLRNIFGGQAAHAVLLTTLLACTWWTTRLPGFFAGEFAGLDTRTWFVLVILNAVIHQVYVWVCWRSELYAQGMTRVFGAAAFTIYAILFAVQIIARPILVTLLSISNAGTLPLPEIWMQLLALLLCVPVVYLIYSIHRYFGFERAFGIDHFDPASRDWPIVRDGIFRFTSNGMYVYGFLMLWIPALFFGSVAAVVAAAFSHAYIWVHYFVTEKPDMNYIYGRAP